MRPQKKNVLMFVFATAAISTFATGWAVTGADGAGDTTNAIIVEHLSGDVDVTSVGVSQILDVGSALDVPAWIKTGSDGNLSIRQSRTGVLIAPESDIEIPEGTRNGQLVARMIQHRGQAFYDVEPRPIEKLRVETPFLVAVVKGTQFSVAIDDEQTTVSLFEGLLEVQTLDGQQVVELAAGQIAVGSITGGIQVLPMDADLIGETAAVNNVAGDPRGVSNAAAIREIGETTNVDAGTASISVSTGIGTGGELRSGTESLSVATGVDVGGDLGSGSVDAGLDAGLDVGGDLGGGSVDAGLDAGVDVGGDLGGGSVDAGLDAGLDVGGDLGGGSVDAGLDAGLDVGGDLGGVEIEAELEVADLDLGENLDPVLDLGTDGIVDTDTGESADVDADAGLDDILPPLL